MDQARKAFVMLAAAVTMTSLGTAAAQASTSKAPPKGKQVKKQAKAEKGKVDRVQRARRRPADFDPDLSMPAGTAYDVIQEADLP